MTITFRSLKLHGKQLDSDEQFEDTCKASQYDTALKDKQDANYGEIIVMDILCWESIKC